MEAKQKILFCGDVEGKFKSLFSRVESINKKSGPFDLLLCVGNFFGVNNKEFEIFKSNIKKVPLPTYVLGPNKEEHVDLYPEEGSELCSNVHYLGKRGLYTNSNGLKIAYISGITTNNSSSPETYTYTVNDAVALRDVCRRGNPSFRGVDILITSQWPQDIMRYDPNYKLKTTINMHSDLAAWLALQLKPRYHISGLEGLFYERAPYRSMTTSDDDTAIELATRFLGLARVGNPNKDKWLYALSLTPLDKMNIKELLQKTTDEIPCPFSLMELENKLFKNKRKTMDSSQYFYDMNTYDETKNRDKKGKRPKIEFDQSKCWFCLASPSVEKHLVVTVGNLVYLALAKGGLVDEHFLICPIEHHQCITGLSDAIAEELQQFKDALIKFFAVNGKVPIFFERNYKTSHMQIQVIPVPKAATKELKEIFMDEAEGNGFKLEELEAHNRLDQVIPTRAPYFCVELPTGEMLYTKIVATMNFPINFGREVLASAPILNLPERIDWRECSLDKADEEALVKRLRISFEPFDFTL